MISTVFLRQSLIFVVLILSLSISSHASGNSRYVLECLFQVSSTIEKEYYRSIDESVLFNGAVREISIKKGIKSVAVIKNRADFDKYFNNLCSLYPHDVSIMGEAAVNGMIKSLNDPYSMFFDTAQWEYYRQVSSGGSFAGIGVELAKKDGRFIIVAPITGGPAEKSGLRPGDVIVSVASKNISNMDDADILALFDGKPLTELALGIERNKKPMTFRIQRQMLSLPPPKASVLKSGKSVGYVRIYYFGPNTDMEVRKYLDVFSERGIKHLIIDLRNNPGGDFQSSLRLASFFTGKKVLIKMAKKGEGLADVYGRSDALYPFRVAILINEGSASASEVFACALRDNNLASLIGTKSFGKALIQSVYSLPGNAGCKLTTAKYYTPGGEDILYKGLKPGIISLTSYPMPDVSKDAVVLKALSVL